MLPLPTRRNLTTSLDSDANGNYFEFHSDYLDLAHGLCPFLYPAGLLHYVCTQAEWDAIHPPVLNAAGVLEPIPFPAAPVIPPALGANAAGAAIALRERQHREYIEEIQAAHHLKDSLLSAIGIDNCRLLADAFTGMRLVSCRDIVDRMRLEHGTASVATLHAWRTALDLPLDPTKPFSHLATSHRFLCARFQEAGQPLSEFVKCSLLAAAVSMYPEYSKAIQDYNTITPILGLRTVADLSAYVMLHQPSLTTAAGAGYAHAAMAPAMLHAVNQAVAQAFSAARAGGGSAGRSGARRRVRAGPVGRGDLAHSTPPAGLPLTPRRYCHVHGYDGHIGRHCRVMTQANIASPGTYSSPQLTAIDHVACAGSSANL